MILDQLVIEITRRCNAFCEHCIRGNSQNIDINKKIIDTALTGLEEINCVTFTGGEPSLFPQGVEMFNEFVIQNKIPVNSFYIVTNGKKFSKKLVSALNVLYSIVQHYNVYQQCYLRISNDMYHPAHSNNAINAYQNLPYFDARYYTDKKNINKLIINEGRALLNGIGEIDIPKSASFIIDEYDVVYQQVYLNTKGSVLSYCDYSYETQEKRKIGNVKNGSLKEIINKTGVKEWQN